MQTATSFLCRLLLCCLLCTGYMTRYVQDTVRTLPLPASQTAKKARGCLHRHVSTGQADRRRREKRRPSYSGEAYTYTLHPSMMDAAFHASVGLLVRSIHDDADSHELSLPFAMQEVEVYGPCPEHIWSYIRYTEGSKAANGKESSWLSASSCIDRTSRPTEA